MQKLVHTFLISMVMMGYALAETITIDGVVDLTPGQTYTKAGGGLMVYANISDFIKSEVFSVNRPNSEYKFGEETVKKIILKSTPRNEESFAERKKIKIGAKCANSKVVKFCEVFVEKERNPINTEDHRFRVEVTEFTPGVDGKPGTAKLNLKEL